MTSVAVGDHIIVAWNPPCGNCRACLRGESNLCVQIFYNIAGAANFSQGGSPVFGFAGTGTFAEEMVVPEQGVVKMPDDVPFEIGALIGCGVTTGVGAALNTAKVVPGSSVVVYGAGGVGIAAIQGARIAGAAQIVAVDTVDSKLKTALRFGATRGVKPDDVDAANMEINEGEGFDYAFECIGLPSTVRAAYDAVRRGGTAVIVGAGQRRRHGRVQLLRAVLHGEEVAGVVLRLGQREVRVRPAHRPVEGGTPRPRGHDLGPHGHLEGPRRLRCHEEGRDHPPDPHFLSSQRATNGPAWSGAVIPV